MDLGKDYDLTAAYELYLERFAERFGDKPVGAFVKLDKQMVTKLSRADFSGRLATYLKMHEACKQMLNSGSTISDAIVLDFAEAAAWICVKAPDLMAMFRGELGDPDETAPLLRSTLPVPKG
jgi:hypothetical protein